MGNECDYSGEIIEPEASNTEAWLNDPLQSRNGKSLALSLQHEGFIRRPAS